jgi:hypothetical protein
LQEAKKADPELTKRADFIAALAISLSGIPNSSLDDIPEWGEFCRLISSDKYAAFPGRTQVTTLLDKASKLAVREVMMGATFRVSAPFV